MVAVVWQRFLNIPDFTRYAKSQKAQILGQTLGLQPR